MSASSCTVLPSGGLLARGQRWDGQAFQLCNLIYDYYIPYEEHCAGSMHVHVHEITCA